MTIPADYPSRDVNWTVPSILETELTGWTLTIRFTRRGHRYDIKFLHGNLPECLRDDKPIPYDKLNSVARSVVTKAENWIVKEFGK